MYNHNKNEISPYDPTKLAIFYIFRPEGDLISTCVVNFKTIVLFDEILHCIDEEDITTYSILIVVLLLFLFCDFEWEVKVNRQLLCEITLPSAADAATYLGILQMITLA